MTSGVALNVVVPPAASRKSWRGEGGGRKARRGHSRNSSSTTSLPPPFHFNNRYEVSGRCEKPRPSSSSVVRCSLLCPPEMPPPIIISMRKAMRLFSDISKYRLSKSDQGEKKKGDSEKIRYWFRSMMKFSFRVSQFADCLDGIFFDNPLSNNNSEKFPRFRLPANYEDADTTTEYERAYFLKENCNEAEWKCPDMFWENLSS